MKGRVFNYSSLSVLVYAYNEQKGYERWYRLAPGCETPVDLVAKILMASPDDTKVRQNATIDGERAWDIQESAVHIIDIDASAPRKVAHSNDVPIRFVGLATFKPMRPPIPEVRNVGDLTLVPRRPWVTILGAGIAGLTAAHELVERGFQVQVVEKNHGSPVDKDQPRDDGADRFTQGLVEPDLGGIARTQWCTAPMTREKGQASLFGKVNLRDRNAPPMRTNSIHGDGDWYGSRPEGWHARAHGTKMPCPVIFDGKNGLDKAASRKVLADWLTAAQAMATAAALQIVVVIYREHENQAGDLRGPNSAYVRLKEFVDWFPSEAWPALRFVEAFPVARIDVDEEILPTGGRDSFVGLLVRYHDQLGLIAGEHGFRFFPGFYRHLRDTLKRTPIYDPADRRFTERTVHDNLTEVSYQTIEDPTRRHGSSFLRKRFSSVGAMVTQYAQLRADLGYRPSDLLRFILRIARYMTSSKKRRKNHYEKLSWWDFVSARHLGSIEKSDPGVERPRLPYGERFARAIRHSPEALVAMKSDIADARTQGNISVQLAMDQLDLHESTDSTLSGPTSESWFRHWRAYLKQQGVKFYVGEVTSISYPDDQSYPGAAKGHEDTFPRGVHVDIAFPGVQAPSSFFKPLTSEAEAHQAHYYVCAMDAVALQRVLTPLRRVPQADKIGVLTSIDKLVVGQERRNPEDLRIGQDLQLPYQTLTGVQLYYLPRVSFDAAHIYYADSAWGLSSVSQIQYWGPIGTGGTHSKLLGNLSIDIGSWRPRHALEKAARPENRKELNALAPAPDPSRLEPGEIAKEICKEINSGRKSDGPTPAYYHLDDYIQFKWREDKLLPTWNRSPFLINTVGEWDDRPPGDPWSPNDRPRRRSHTPGAGEVVLYGVKKYQELIWRHEDKGYEVYFSNLVFCGTHMRTFTRMGTMEAANESARHAVNAILDHLTWRENNPEAPGNENAPPPGPPARRIRTLEGRLSERNLPERLATPYGDYCDIWDPEENEIEDFRLLKRIDKHLYETKKTNPRSGDDMLEPQGSHQEPAHLFDLLGLDRLPDLIDTDADAQQVLDLLRAGLEELKKGRSGDLDGILASIETLRKLYTTFKPSRT